jgi:hypothetical protein
VIKLPQVDQEVIFAILNGMGIPLPQFFKEDGTPVKMSGNIAPWFELKDSNIMQQTDLNRRYQKHVQTHANVAVPNGQANASGWIDTNGYNAVGITILNSVAAASFVDIYWSNDGVAVHGAQYSQLSSAAMAKTVEVPTTARWIKLSITNSHTAPVNITAGLYLKV